MKTIDPKMSAHRKTAITACIGMLLAISVWAAPKAPALRNFIFDATTFAIDSRPQAMAIGDVTGDNRPDIVVVNAQGGSPASADYRILVYANGKAGALQAPAVYGAKNGTDVAIGDLNGDGRNDVITTGNSGFAVLYQLADHTLGAAQIISGVFSSRLAVGDLTGDGRLDVATIDSTREIVQVAIYRQQAGGGFTLQQVDVLTAVDVAIRDVDGNGLQDLVVLGRNGTIGFMLQTTQGILSPPRYTQPELGTRATALAVDVAPGSALPWIGTTNGISGETPQIQLFATAEENLPALGETISTSDAPEALAFGDLNLDGRQDLVVLHGLSGGVGIYRKLSDGSWDAEDLYAVPATDSYEPHTIAVRDMNLDGMPDIVVLSPEQGLTILTQKVSILIPHIATSSAWETHLVLDNVGDTYADAVIAMFNPDSGDDYQAFFVYPGQSVHTRLPSGTCGTVTYTGGNLVVREIFVNTEPDGGGLAEFLLDGRSAPDFTIPLPAYNGENLTWMGIAIFNPTETDATATLTAVDENGSILGTADVSVHAHQRIVGILDSLFPGIDMLRTARVDVSSDQSLTGIAISGNGNEKLLFSRAALDTAGGTLLLPHYARQSQGWDTRLVLDNTSGVEQTVTLTLVGAGVTQDSFLLRVPASSSRTFNLNNLASDPESVEAGWLSVPDGVIAREAFLNTEPDGGGTAEFRLSDAASPFLVLNYPSYAMDLITWRGVAVFNPTAEAQTVTVRLYANNALFRTTTVDVGAWSRYRVVLEDLFPGIENSPVTTATLEGSGPLSGLNISGAGTARLLFDPATPR